MSLRASPSPVVEENRAHQVSLPGGSLMLDGAEGAWGHSRKTSEPSVPSNPGPGSQEDEIMAVPGVTPAVAAMSATPPLNLPSNPPPSRPNSGHPRVSTAVDQPAVQRSISSIDQESKDSPVRSSVSFKMSDSSTSSQAPDHQSQERGPPSVSDVTVESRRLRTGSAAEADWERIQKLRNENWSLRSQIREMRNNLRQLQEGKSKADDILFRRLTVHGLGFAGDSSLPHGQKTLSELMHDCQVARDAYGPLEDDCNDLEDQLSGQEFELDRLEEAFYKRPPDEASIVSERPLTPAGVDDFHAYPPSSVDEEEEETEYHPLVSRYLSKMGDLDLLQERLDDLLDEKRGLEEEQTKRHRFGLTLDREDQQWLENAHSQEDDLLEKIDILEKDLEVMKQDCLSRGLIDADGEPVDFQIREQRSFDGEEDLNPLDQKSEYVKYPLLLPHPGVKAPTYEPEITNPSDRSNRTITQDSSSETYDTTSRINNWLLQRLRGSALDVNLLARTFQALAGTINAPHRWQIAVLRLWFRDATMKNADGGLRVYTDSMTTQAPVISAPSEGIKMQERRPDGVRGVSFSHLSRSEIEDDEVEIVEYTGSHRRR